MVELSNKEMATILRELADLLEIRGENRFKVRAYYNAARRLTAINQDRDAQGGPFSGISTSPQLIH